jgi:pyridoxamine 5'-phosphate oxidase
LFGSLKTSQTKVCGYRATVACFSFNNSTAYARVTPSGENAMPSPAEMRKEYTVGGLSESDAGAEPFALFQKWFDQAIAAELPEPNAFTLATVGANGAPSARVVLLKGLDDRGLQFFTNYESRKGRELAANPQAAVVFLWAGLERQVRVEGEVVKVSEEESDRYFHSRPANSRLGAWASPQSRVIASRALLEQAEEELRGKFGSAEIHRPPHWGGYRIVPRAFEFWQGRPSRLHDRILFERIDGKVWRIVRLAP